MSAIDIFELIRPGQLWKHVKTGREYRIVGVGILDADPSRRMVCYQNAHGADVLWIRPVHEFIDGRFERMT